jgi:hypothetical protein
MRASYRVQTLMRVVFGLLVLATVPLAALAGRATYHDVVAHNARAEARVQIVPATLDADVPEPTSMPAAGFAVVPAHWTAAGRRHTGQFGVVSSMRKGDTVPLRVGPTGEPAPAPAVAEPATNAVVAAVMTFTMSNICLIALWRTYSYLADRRRRAQWAREWNALGDTPDWNHL